MKALGRTRRQRLLLRLALYGGTLFYVMDLDIEGLRAELKALGSQ